MGEVFAGFLAGYILTVITTPLFAFGLIRMRATSPVLARLLPGINVLSVSVILHGALFFFWTAVGMILGLLLLAMSDSDAALGSANLPFTLFVAGLVLATVAPVYMIVRPWRRGVAIGALVVLLTFGWLMPWLAEWSTFD